MCDENRDIQTRKNSDSTVAEEESDETLGMHTHCKPTLLCNIFLSIASFCLPVVFDHN